MEEDFQAWVCSDNWWNSTGNGFPSSLSPCSKALKDLSYFEWATSDIDEMNSRPCAADPHSAANSFIIAELFDSVNGDGFLMDSTLQMVGSGLPSPTIDWSQILLSSKCRDKSIIHSDFQNPNSGLDSPKAAAMKPTSFPSGGSKDLDSYQQRLDTTQEHPSASSQGQGLLDLQPQQPTQDKRSTSCPSAITHSTNSNETLIADHKQPVFMENTSCKQQQSGILFSNTSVETMNGIQQGFFPSLQSEFHMPNFEVKRNCGDLTTKPNSEDCEWVSMEKSASEPAPKRPRIGAPSPLPTFKVRKEKLGDRITALQQLVSPFGKTDTASVLFEAIEYIKFLHEKVSVLSSYMNDGVTIPHQQNSDGDKQDLRSRGLCIVPISSTFSVTKDTGSDIWAPIFGVPQF